MRVAYVHEESVIARPKSEMRLRNFFSFFLSFAGQPIPSVDLKKSISCRRCVCRDRAWFLLTRVRQARLSHMWNRADQSRRYIRQQVNVHARTSARCDNSSTKASQSGNKNSWNRAETKWDVNNLLKISLFTREISYRKFADSNISFSADVKSILVARQHSSSKLSNCQWVNDLILNCQEIEIFFSKKSKTKYSIYNSSWSPIDDTLHQARILTGFDRGLIDSHRTWLFVAFVLRSNVNINNIPKALLLRTRDIFYGPKTVFSSSQFAALRYFVRRMQAATLAELFYCVAWLKTREIQFQLKWPSQVDEIKYANFD